MMGEMTFKYIQNLLILANSGQVIFKIWLVLSQLWAFHWVARCWFGYRWTLGPSLSCQCTVECNLDSVLIVPADDLIPRQTQTKVRIACLSLNEELPVKNGRGWRKPWVAGKSGAWGQRAGTGPQAVNSRGTSGKLEHFSGVRISFVKWRN